MAKLAQLDVRALQDKEDMEIMEGVAGAVRNALLQHKRAGNPIAVWEDGKVVWIPAEEIDVPDPDAPATE